MVAKLLVAAILFANALVQTAQAAEPPYPLRPIRIVVTNTAGSGADVVVKPPGSSFTSFGGSPLPEKMAAVLATRPHVVQAMGTFTQPVPGASPWDFISGIHQDEFDRMSGGFIYRSGHGLRGQDDVLVDTDYAAQRRLKVGSKVTVLNREWTVAGIVEPGKLAHVFARIDRLQDLENQPGKISQIFLKIDKEENIDGVVKALQAELGDTYPIYSMQQLQTLTSVDSYPILRTFINVVIGIGVVIGFAVVSLSMYMAVLQRTREIGILKSMGARKRMVMGLILSEASFLGFGGTVIGILLSFVSRYVLRAIVPSSLPSAIVVSWWPIAGAVAMVAALLGALYPGMLAVRQDPIEALAHE